MKWQPYPLSPNSLSHMWLLTLVPLCHCEACVTQTVRTCSVLTACCQVISCTWRFINSNMHSDQTVFTAGLQCLRLALYSYKIIDGGSLFAFQITVCWRSLICRQSCQRGIRLISMKSKEHTIPSKFAPWRVCCILASALPLQVSLLSSSGTSGADLCCFSFQLGRRLQSQRCPTARNGSDENQTPRGADGAAQETRRGRWPKRAIVT